jgi:polar amino acid transport system permease protein
MSRGQALRRIILPQAVVAMIPPWGNLFIELLKATALVSLITIPDLAFRAQQMNATTYRTIEIFSIVLVFYLAIAMLITIAMQTIERLASRGLARGRAG